jgi:hypothetical protein
MPKLFVGIALAVAPLLAGAAAQQIPPEFAAQVGPAIKQQCLSQVPKDQSLAKALGQAPSAARVEDFCDCTSKLFVRSVSPNDLIDPANSDAKAQAAVKQKMQAKVASASKLCSPRLGNLASTSKPAPASK